MKGNVSVLVGLKNNISLSKFFYSNFRADFPDTELILVSYGSKDGTAEWLDSLDDAYLIYHHSPESKTLSDTYNTAAQLATNDFVVFMHNDMVLGRHFIKNLNDSLDGNYILGYRIVEPPIFENDKKDWKIIKDFGRGIKDFDKAGFLEFESELLQKNRNAITDTQDAFFFLCIKKSVLLYIGGLDPLFDPMFSEDDDLLFRLKLLGLKAKLTHKSIAYHFVSQTSRFSAEYQAKTKILEEKSRRNFVRKWGFENNSESKVKYDIGIILYNADDSSIREIEPFATVLYTDGDIEKYISEERVNTKFNLNERIKALSEFEKHDIEVKIDGRFISDKTLRDLRNLPSLIMRQRESKKHKITALKKYFYKLFKKDRIEITINLINSLEHNLIIKSI